jgi:hypothetical protein
MRVSISLSPLHFAEFGVLAEKSSPNSDTFQPIPVVRPTDALPLPSESQPLEQSGRFPECQLNNPACGGARLSGNRTGSADRALPNK